VSELGLPALQSRAADSHKGNFGNALLIGGSRGMAGAIALSGMSAVRSGAGLVRLAVPDCCLETVAAFSPCAMLIPIERQDSAGKICGLTDDLCHWLTRSNGVAIGPGLNRSAHLDLFVLDLLQFMAENNSAASVVIDADGLNALACRADWWRQLKSPTVLTPHPGEWSRLCGVPASQPEQQAQAAQAFAAKAGCTILLKGYRTLITNGAMSVRNQTGTPAMSTGGSGDVLTGVITALICQGLSPFQAAHLAAHVHGLAGQIAENEIGSHVVLPTELIQYLPAAFAEVTARQLA
jgi:ADP-dependent NAD(P)H-hydrate dehydratase